MEQIGEIETYEKYKSGSKIEGKIKIATLYYKCETSKKEETIYFKFELVEADGNPPQIKSILYSQNKKFIDNYDENKEKVLDEAESYYKNLKTDDSEGIYDMLDESITDDEKIVESFFSIIDKRRSYYGRIESKKYSHAKSDSYDGKTRFYIYYKCKSEEGKEFYEEISFIEAGSQFKIHNLRYAETFEDIESI